MGTSARLEEPPAKDRVEPKRLAEEQAALRRVATLVARGASSTEVFAAVAREVAQGGLGPALKTLAHRSPIPVELDVRVDGRLPAPVEVTAYYVVSEALTNAAKHAEASIVRVDVDVRDGMLCAAVLDDGVGGADPLHGSGLLGLKDRAEAIGGRISLDSSHGAGTSLRVELPLGNLDGS